MIYATEVTFFFVGKNCNPVFSSATVYSTSPHDKKLSSIEQIKSLIKSDLKDSDINIEGNIHILNMIELEDDVHVNSNTKNENNNNKKKSIQQNKLHKDKKPSKSSVVKKPIKKVKKQVLKKENKK